MDILTNIQKLGKEYFLEKQGKINYVKYLNKIIQIKNGNIWKECNYKDGKLYGLYKSYYENGNIEIECNCKDGKLDGLYKDYYENGNVETETNYKDNKRDGLYKKYNENGNIEIEYNYKDGKLNGLFKVYDKNGNIVIKITGKNIGEKEVEKLESVQHLDIIPKLYDSFLQDGKMYIVQELVRGKTIHDSWVSTQSWDFVWLTIYQILLTIRELHGEGFSHGDAHSNNFMWSGEKNGRYRHFLVDRQKQGNKETRS